MQGGKRRLLYKQQVYHTLGGKDDERQTDMQKAPKLCMWGLFTLLYQNVIFTPPRQILPS